MPAPKDPEKRALWIQRKSAVMRGKPGAWLGKKHDETTKKKISETLTGKKITPEQRERQLEGIKKHTESLTPEQRFEKGKSNRGKHFTEEHKRKIGEANKGKPPASKGKRYTEEEKAVRYANIYGNTWGKGRPMPEHVKEMLRSPEIKAKRMAVRKANFDALTPEERRAKIQPWIDAGRKAWNEYYTSLSDEERAAIVKRMHTGKSKDTDIELFVASLLDASDIPYEKQKHFGRYIVDFFLSEQDIILEVNGCYWHQCERCGFNYDPEKREYDRKRTETLEAGGHTVYILWEHDLHPFMKQKRGSG